MRTHYNLASFIQQACLHEGGTTRCMQAPCLLFALLSMIDILSSLPLVRTISFSRSSSRCCSQDTIMSSLVTPTLDTRRLGNLFHAALLVSNTLFCSLVVYSLAYKPTLLDPVWLEAGGFCVAQAVSHNTHHVCSWVDLLLSITCLALYYQLHKAEGMSKINLLFLAIVPATILHGLGHAVFAQVFDQVQLGGLGKHHFDATPRDFFGTGQIVSINRYTLLVAAFWMAMIKAAMYKASWLSISCLTCIVSIGQIDLPAKYSFVYIQTVIFMAFSINELIQPAKAKDWVYMTFPALVGIPLMTVSWIEALACRVFVRDYLYGHVVYDALLPIGAMVWYYANYLHHNEGFMSIER
jgi:hypothetical protein